MDAKTLSALEENIKLFFFAHQRLTDILTDKSISDNEYFTIKDVSNSLLRQILELEKQRAFAISQIKGHHANRI